MRKYILDNSFKRLLPLAKIGLNFLLPLLIYFSSAFKVYSSSILLFYVKINNIIVKSSKKKYLPEHILILLPHCLQYSKCPHKITGFIDNCHKCNKCEIGSIRDIAKEHNISSIEVVSGGTIARTIVQRIKPKIIIAVACERDLALGIADIRKIPTIGILNKRPNGPCFNTTIDIAEFGETIEFVINK